MRPSNATNGTQNRGAMHVKFFLDRNPRFSVGPQLSSGKDVGFGQFRIGVLFASRCRPMLIPIFHVLLMGIPPQITYVAVRLISISVATLKTIRARPDEGSKYK